MIVYYLLRPTAIELGQSSKGVAIKDCLTPLAQTSKSLRQELIASSTAARQKCKFVHTEEFGAIFPTETMFTLTVVNNPAATCTCLHDTHPFHSPRALQSSSKPCAVHPSYHLKQWHVDCFHSIRTIKLFLIDLPNYLRLGSLPNRDAISLIIISMKSLKNISIYSCAYFRATMKSMFRASNANDRPLIGPVPLVQDCIQYWQIDKNKSCTVKLFISPIHETVELPG